MLNISFLCFFKEMTKDSHSNHLSAIKKWYDVIQMNKRIVVDYAALENVINLIA